MHKAVNSPCSNLMLGCGRHRHKARVQNGNAEKGSWQPRFSQWQVPTKVVAMVELREGEKPSGCWENQLGGMCQEKTVNIHWCPDSSEHKVEQGLQVRQGLSSTVVYKSSKPIK